MTSTKQDLGHWKNRTPKTNKGKKWDKGWQGGDHENVKNQERKNKEGGTGHLQDKGWDTKEQGNTQVSKEGGTGE